MKHPLANVAHRPFPLPARLARIPKNDNEFPVLIQSTVIAFPFLSPPIITLWPAYATYKTADIEMRRRDTPNNAVLHPG